MSLPFSHELHVEYKYIIILNSGTAPAVPSILAPMTTLDGSGWSGTKLEYRVVSYQYSNFWLELLAGNNNAIS